MSGIYEALSEVDQSNVQVMAYDKVVRSIHVVRMNNVAMVEKAQGVHHLRCPKHKKFLESFFGLFVLFKCLLDREFDSGKCQMSLKDPISALIWYPSSQSGRVSGSVQKNRQVVRETNRMHDIHHGGKQIRNVSKSKV